MRTSLKRAAVVAALVAGGMLIMSCRVVGTGHLNVANDLSGIGADNTEFRAYVAESGDPWPPAGTLSISVTGDDFGRAPSYGMNGYLYLVRANAACPQSEGAPEVFTLAQVTIVGIVTVREGNVNQFLTMDDTPAARQSRFALMEIVEFPGASGGHLIHRCGTVTWS